MTVKTLLEEAMVEEYCDSPIPNKILRIEAIDSVAKKMMKKIKEENAD